MVTVSQKQPLVTASRQSLHTHTHARTQTHEELEHEQVKYLHIKGSHTDLPAAVLKHQ